MHLLAWAGIGAVVGWGAGRIFQGDSYGPFMAILYGYWWRCGRRASDTFRGLRLRRNDYHHAGCND